MPHEAGQCAKNDIDLRRAKASLDDEQLEPHGWSHLAPFLAQCRAIAAETPPRVQLRLMRIRLRLLKCCVREVKRQGRAQQRAARHFQAERDDESTRARQSTSSAARGRASGLRMLRATETQRRREVVERERLAPGCGARGKRSGLPCRRRPYLDPRTGRVRNGRCHLHGGKSTGPRTIEGRARISAVQTERWDAWRQRRAT